MRSVIALVILEMGIATAAAAATPSVDIRDAVARVTVIPEDRADIKVEMLTTNRDLPLDVRQSGEATVISGGLAHRINGCHSRGEHPSASVRGVGRVDFKDMPQVVVHAPRSVVISAGGVVIGVVGRAQSLDLSDSGCNAWTIADVAGDAVLRESGAGALRMGSANHLDAQMSGATKIHATQLKGLKVTLSGVGGLDVDSVSGPIQAQVSGVGRIKVLEGHATTMRAVVSGLGGIDFGGQADGLDAAISGLGDIRVKSVSGPVTKTVSGGGHVTIG